jgi:hypothetical protein
MTLIKTGTGRLYFTQTTNENSLRDTSTLQIQGGQLVLVGSTAASAKSSIGKAEIKLDGGGLILDSKGATTAGVGPSYNNSITVMQNAVVQSVVNAATVSLAGTKLGFTTSTGSNSLILGNTEGLQVGQTVTGYGIAPGTTISSISGPNSLTLSANATASGASSLSFGNTIVISSNRTLTLDAIAGGRGTAGATLAVAGNVTGDATTTLSLSSSLMNSSAAFPATLASVNISSGNPEVVVSSTVGLIRGAIVSGTGIPPNTTIQSIDSFTNTITLSNDPTESAIVTLTLAAPASLVSFNSPGGTVILRGDNTAFLGGIVLQDSRVNLQAEGVDSFSNKSVTLNGGNTLTLLSDGDGTGQRQSLLFNSDVNLDLGPTATFSTTMTVGRVGTYFAPFFAQAANKTVRMDQLTIGKGTLTVANNNGYGLEFGGGISLVGAPTFSVASQTNSNVVAGLTLSGVVSEVRA